MMTETVHQRLFPLWAGLLVISGLAPPFAGGVEITDTLLVKYADGQVSVSARNVPVTDIIEAIADQAGLRLVEHVEIDRQVTLDIDAQPLPDALAIILDDDSFTLYQAAPDADDDADVIPGTLWVFSTGTSLAPAATVFYEAVLYRGTVREKKEAIRELRRLGTPAAVQALSLALGDDDVRDAALSALSRIGSDEALSAIASVSLDSDPRARGEAAAALGSGDRETAARYLAMALDDPDPRVRMAVVESLADVPFGTVPDQLTVATLTRALRDEDPEVRMSAVDAMEEIGGPVVHQTLMQANTDDESEMPKEIQDSLLAPEE